METIFTILIIILPIVFRLIGRKLEQAGQQTGPSAQDNQTPIEDWAEVLRRHIEAQQSHVPVQIPQVPAEVDTEPAVVRPAAVKVEPKADRSLKPNVAQQVVTTPVEEGLAKIDKKKLIVYSEIMKPKYTE